MPKLLLTVTQPQHDWMREEAARLELPGGVSELARRIVDRARAERFPRLGLENLTPACVQCGKQWSETVACAGGDQRGPLCGECF